VEFLDRFSPSERQRLRAAGRLVRLREDALLIRRGERGGDIFLVEEGSFEVVDTSTLPEVVLGNLGPGQVVGEFSFVDAAPRSADVRAAGEAAARVWEREALLALFESQPGFAASFYRALATATVERLRTVSASAVAGGLGLQSGSGRVGAGDRSQARTIAARVQAIWIEADTALRRDPRDAVGLRNVDQGFALLLEQSTTWLRGFADPEVAVEAGDDLSRDLRAYLNRAVLAELAMDPPSRRSGDPRLLAHVLVDRARGDGILGERLDAALLALPSCAAIRRRTEVAARSVAAALPSDRPASLMMVNATCGALLARLVPELARQGADVRIVDSSREALAFLDAGLTTRPPSVSLKLVQEDLGALVLGRSSSFFEAVDFVVVDALFDYLPDRLAAALVSWVRDHLKPGGAVIVTGLASAEDAWLMDHVLGWPMVRREAAELRTLVEACGLKARVVAGQNSESGPVVVIEGRRPMEPAADGAVG
jgi:CRP/FNR family transcriptional regulator, cyclic AMP receptor protein